MKIAPTSCVVCVCTISKPSHKWNSTEAGIALGPILFIIALLAILAAVIASGSRGFNVGTNDKKIKQAAVTVLDRVKQYQESYQMVNARGGDPYNLPWVMTWVWPDDVRPNRSSSFYKSTDDPFSPSGGGTTWSPRWPMIDDLASDTPQINPANGHAILYPLADVNPTNFHIGSSSGYEYTLWMEMDFDSNPIPTSVVKFCHQFNKLPGYDVDAVLDTNGVVLPAYQGLTAGCATDPSWNYMYLNFLVGAGVSITCANTGGVC